MEELTYDNFLLAMQEIAKRINKLPGKSIYGIRRGGMVPAVYLSHLTGRRIVPSPGKKTIIVDDICDSGTTLYDYKKLGYKTATIYYHKQNIVEPDIWIYEKKDDWILFPWETRKSSKGTE